ncbi:MAG: SAM-dependent methyltransferase [Acidimicrobiia bacterium]|nr:SAM-dependent methyltransferase [Acidimicrobiia bacterium]
MRALIEQRIRNRGPMPFDEFMELCLYHPEQGYFSAGSVRPGIAGDFVTAPEVSPWFGRLVGRWATDRLPPDHTGWSFIDIGAGSGALIDAARREIPDDVALIAVERSTAARRVLADRGITAVPSVDAVPSGPAIVVMNEVVDNVPAALVRRRGDRLLEVMVEIGTPTGERGTFSLTEHPVRPGVAAWVGRYLPILGDGSLAVVQPGVTDLLDAVLAKVGAGALCIIDYGGGSDVLASRPLESLVRTYRHQRTGFDFLRHPGETDITVDMNTDVLTAWAQHNGLSVEGRTQAEFLEAAGARIVMAELTAAEHAAAAANDVMGQLAVRSEAVGVTALLDPGGFGAFDVVLMDREPNTPVEPS